MDNECVDVNIQYSDLAKVAEEEVKELINKAARERISKERDAQDFKFEYTLDEDDIKLFFEKVLTTESAAEKSVKLMAKKDYKFKVYPGSGRAGNTAFGARAGAAGGGAAGGLAGLAGGITTGAAAGALIGAPAAGWGAIPGGIIGGIVGGVIGVVGGGAVGAGGGAAAGAGIGAAADVRTVAITVEDVFKNCDGYSCEDDIVSCYITKSDT